MFKHRGALKTSPKHTFRLFVKEEKCGKYILFSYYFSIKHHLLVSNNPYHGLWLEAEKK